MSDAIFAAVAALIGAGGAYIIIRLMWPRRRGRHTRDED